MRKRGEEPLSFKCVEDALLVCKPYDEKFFQRNLARTLKVSLALKTVAHRDDNLSSKRKVKVAVQCKFKLELAFCLPDALTSRLKKKRDVIK